jgi:hypothetical protein
VSFHRCHERRELMHVLGPSLHATADRHRAPLEEFRGAGLEAVDIAPGREIYIPVGPPRPCAHCWGQRTILHRGEYGWDRMPCGRCFGSGWDPS